jgi:hypothetical protein
MGQEKRSEVIVTVRPVHLRTMSDDSAKLDKSRDYEDDTVSQFSSATSFKDVEAGKSAAKWYLRSESSSLRSWFRAARASNTNKKQLRCRWMLIAVVVLGLFGVIAAM